VLRGNTDWASSRQREWVVHAGQAFGALSGDSRNTTGVQCSMFVAGSYTCLCEAGYSRHNCDSDANECASLPCQNGGVCLDSVSNPGLVGPGSMLCNCSLGWQGALCDQAINECSSAPCHNGGLCIDMPGTFNCTCMAGFLGLLCDIDVDECASSPCVNQATCTESQNSSVPAGSYACICLTGWSGYNCDTDYDECSSNPCQVAGYCFDSSTVVVAYTSFEEPQTVSGALVAYRDLDSSPQHALRNHAGQNPVAYVGSYITAKGGRNITTELGFATFWQGSPTEIGFRDGNFIGVVGDDTTLAMSGGGAAPHGSQYYMLADTDGFAYVRMDSVQLSGAKHASISCWVHVESTSWEADDYIRLWGDVVGAPDTVLIGPVDVDTMQEDAWIQHSANISVAATNATAVAIHFGMRSNSLYEEAWFDYCKVEAHVSLGEYTCRCIKGASGLHDCASDFDECVSNPCANGAVCADSNDRISIAADSYVCSCAAGFEGFNCHVDTDECASTPCQHNSTCSDSSTNASVAIASFYCACLPGWQGSRCHVDVDECASAPCGIGLTCIDSNDNPFIAVASRVAVDAFGCIVVAAPPPLPTNLTTTGSRSHEVDLAWLPPTIPAAAASISGYRVFQRASSSGGTWQEVYAGGPQTTATVAPLAGGGQFSFKVAAFNVHGLGNMSQAVVCYTAPEVLSTPRVLKDTVTDRYATTATIALTWNAAQARPQAPLLGYRVYLVNANGTVAVVGTASSVTTSFTVSGLSGGSAYNFSVTAENTVGEGNRSPQLLAFTAPVAPTAPVVAPYPSGTTTSVSLLWNGVPDAVAPQSNARAVVTGYHVYLAGDFPSNSSMTDADALSYAEIQEVDPNSAMAWTASGLAGSRRYHLKVSAENLAGEGNRSAATAMYTAPVAPYAPYAATPTDYATPTRIALTWAATPVHAAAPVTSVQAWQLPQRQPPSPPPGSSSSSSGPACVVAAVVRHPTACGATLVGAWNASSMLRNSSGASSYTVGVGVVHVHGLHVDSQYSYSLTATNAAGESVGGAARTLFTAPRPPQRMEVVCSQGGGCGSPNNTSNTSSTQNVHGLPCVVCNSSVARQSLDGAAWYANATAITLRWSAVTAQDPVVEYRIYTRLDNGTNATDDYVYRGAVARAAPQLQHTAGGLRGGSRYQLVVRARSVAGESAAPLTPLLAYTAPALEPPTSRRLSDSSTIFVRWSAPRTHPARPLRELQLLYRRADHGNWTWTAVTLATSSTRAAVAALAASVQYVFMLRADNLAGVALSAEAVLGTAPPPIGAATHCATCALAATMFSFTYAGVPANQQGVGDLRITTYVAYVLDTSSNTTISQTAAVGTSGMMMMGMVGHTTYEVRMAARNRYGDSNLSAPLTLTTPQLLCMPLGGGAGTAGSSGQPPYAVPNHPGYMVTNLSATTMPALGAVSCATNYAGTASATCAAGMLGAAFAFAGCAPACVAGSGNRVGYSVQHPSGTTVAALGNVSCAAGYAAQPSQWGVPPAAQVTCPTPGGSFSFQYCAPSGSGR
jgi:hypothetical protein